MMMLVLKNQNALLLLLTLLARGPHLGHHSSCWRHTRTGNSQVECRKFLLLTVGYLFFGVSLELIEQLFFSSFHPRVTHWVLARRQQRVRSCWTWAFHTDTNQCLRLSRARGWANFSLAFTQVRLASVSCHSSCLKSQLFTRLTN